MRRHAQTLVAQGLNSATNIAVTLLLSRSLDAEGLGAVALVQSVILIGVAFARGVAAESSLFDRATDLTHRLSSATGGALAVGVPVGLAAATVGGLIGHVSFAVVACLALGGAIACGYDGARAALLVAERSDRTLRADVAWVAGQLATTAVLAISGVGGAIVPAAAWMVGAVVAEASALASLRGLGATPHVDRRSLRAGLPWGLEGVIAIGTLQITLVGIAAAATLADAGAIRGAVVLTGPATLLASALYQLALPRFATTDAAGSVVRRAGRRWGAAGMLLSALCTAPLLLVGDDAGRSLLGDTWDGARLVLPWIVLQRTAGGYIIGPQLALRRFGVRWLSVWFRACSTIAVCAAATLAAGSSGVQAAGQVLAVGALATSAIWEILASRSVGPDGSSRTMVDTEDPIDPVPNLATTSETGARTR